MSYHAMADSIDGRIVSLHMRYISSSGLCKIRFHRFINLKNRRKPLKLGSWKPRFFFRKPASPRNRALQKCYVMLRSTNQKCIVLIHAEFPGFGTANGIPKTAKNRGKPESKITFY